MIRVNKVKVMNEDAKWVEKSTKTTSSTREIVVPMDIADKIREKGYIYKGYPNQITVYLGKVEDKLGIPHFPLHKLRHYFVSKMSTLNIPEADIMRMGGWEKDYIMKGVYRHSMMEKKEQAKREAAEKLRNALFS